MRRALNLNSKNPKEKKPVAGSKPPSGGPPKRLQSHPAEKKEMMEDSSLKAAFSIFTNTANVSKAKGDLTSFDLVVETDK